MSEPITASQPPSPPTLQALARAFLYLGVAGYGGGPAIIALMHRYFIDRKRWVHEEDFLTGLSLSQMLPGATAVNFAVYLGYQMRGTVGGWVAPIMIITPAAILMTVLSIVYFAVGQVPFVDAVFMGLSAVVVALVINATVLLGRTAVKDVWGVIIAVLAFLAMETIPARFSPILLVIVASAIIGWLRAGWRGSRDTAPVPVTTAHPRSRWGWIVGIAMILAIVTVIVVAWSSPAVQLAVTLLRVGALTFGGGYAAIPLYQSEAVGPPHNWLTTQQFLDGIALGQVTPGPVLITGTFIGYRALQSIWGALIGTVTVFLPGLVGMHIMVRTHARLRGLWWLQAIVQGVVASYIGILVSVVVVLAKQSLVDWRTWLIAAASLVVIMGAKKDPLWVILGAVVIAPFIFR